MCHLMLLEHVPGVGVELTQLQVVFKNISSNYIDKRP